MDKETFERRLLDATKSVLDHTRELVIDELPSDCCYLINYRQGGDPSVMDGEFFPDDPLINVLQGDLAGALQLLGPHVDVSGVVKSLWRNGKTPHWINIIVHGADERYTYFLLRCSGCFTSHDGVDSEDNPRPFNHRIPSPPPGWKIRDAGNRYMPDMKKSLEVHGKYAMRNFGD